MTANLETRVRKLERGYEGQQVLLGDILKHCLSIKETLETDVSELKTDVAVLNERTWPC